MINAIFTRMRKSVAENVQTKMGSVLAMKISRIETA
jgi:hypothetical protein